MPDLLNENLDVHYSGKEVIGVRKLSFMRTYKFGQLANYFLFYKLFLLKNIIVYMYKQVKRYSEQVTPCSAEYDVPKETEKT